MHLFLLAVAECHSYYISLHHCVSLAHLAHCCIREGPSFPMRTELIWIRLHLIALNLKETDFIFPSSVLMKHLVFLILFKVTEMV